MPSTSGTTPDQSGHLAADGHQIWWERFFPRIKTFFRTRSAAAINDSPEASPCS